jgi:uncharacterized protein (TIGR02246 family)
LAAILAVLIPGEKMPSQRRLRSLVFLLALGACAAPAKAPEKPVDPAALKDAIQAREKEWSAGFLAGNSAAIAALYAENGVSVQAAGDSWTGRAAIAKGEQAQLDTLNVSAREDITEEVIPTGNDHAVEVGHYSYQATSKATKKPVSASGRYMELWQKDSTGVWHILRDIGADAPAKVVAPMKKA